MTSPIPSGYHSVTPSFMFKDSKKALDFYQRAFGAKVLDSFPNMDGKGIMHAVMQIGDSILMMGDEQPGMKGQSAETMGGSPISLFVYVPNVDEAFKKAVDAGAKILMPLAEMFWGDRAGSLLDPFGYQWMIATHTRDMTQNQIQEEAKSFFASAQK